MPFSTLVETSKTASTSAMALATVVKARTSKSVKSTVSILKISGGRGLKDLHLLPNLPDAAEYEAERKRDH
jgi:hypothetical protein